MDNYKQKIQKVIQIESTQLGNDINFRLKLARQKALQSDLKKSVKKRTLWFWYIPSTAVAALALYFLLPLLTVNSKLNEPLNPEHSIVNEIINMEVDMEILDQLELVENLEFYEWLSIEDSASSI